MSEDKSRAIRHDEGIHPFPMSEALSPKTKSNHALRKGNINDISLFLDNADAKLSIRKQSKGIVELEIGDKQALKWVDEDGHAGEIKTEAVASRWGAIEDAGKVRPGIQFTRQDGTISSVILEDVKGKYTEKGTYRFAGDLPSLAGARQKRMEKVVGSEYVNQYKAFASSVRKAGGFKQAINAADLYLDTYSLSDYKNELKTSRRGTSAKDFIDDQAALESSSASGSAGAGNKLVSYLVGASELPGATLSPINAKDVREAFAFAQAGKLPGAPGDPIFQWYKYQPPGVARANQNKAAWPKGDFYYLNSSSAPGSPKSVASKSFSLGDKDQSLDLSFDLGHAAYGYVYVPDGVWSKLNASKYSAGALLGFQTGPSLKLRLGEGQGRFSSPEATLASTEYYSAGLYGTISIKPSLTAKIEGELKLDEGFKKDSLTGTAYANGAMLLTYNTYDKPGFNAEAAYFFDSDFKDFDAITGVTLSPTIAAKLAGS